MDFPIRSDLFFDEILVSKQVIYTGLFCLPMSHRKDARLIWVKHNAETEHYGHLFTFL